MKNQQKMNEKELSLGLTGTSRSWHREYEDSAWVYVGGLPYDLTEGDVICIFSQYVLYILHTVFNAMTLLGWHTERKHLTPVENHA